MHHSDKGKPSPVFLARCSSCPPDSRYNRAMHLQSSDLPAYAAHLAARDDSNVADVLERLRRAIAGARLRLDNIFVTFDPTGERVSGSLRVCVFGKDFVVLTEWRGDEGAGTYEALLELLAGATARAAEIEAPKMGTRESGDISESAPFVKVEVPVHLL